MGLWVFYVVLKPTCYVIVETPVVRNIDYLSKMFIEDVIILISKMFYSSSKCTFSLYFFTMCFLYHDFHHNNNYY